jgi:hypothetical protein
MRYRIRQQPRIQTQVHITDCAVNTSKSDQKGMRPTVCLRRRQALLELGRVQGFLIPSIPVAQPGYRNALECAVFPENIDLIVG